LQITGVEIAELVAYKGERELNTSFSSDNLKERQDIGVEGRVILK
jgi:hypothetical protein